MKGLIASAVNAGWDEVETARAIKIVAAMLLETLDDARDE
ncbi:hypothetical protein CEV34_3239 [Brucella pseudogrignonensis]|uniref:Uncharacterized protein n=1 Tax=Brucella pseudogrignonensis TaxID=419475 RepID=A0A256GAD2_9HYPH|nr:hypothetical protein CEV34_3239 [Brucella pseudogrignonensis]